VTSIEQRVDIVRESTAITRLRTRAHALSRKYDEMILTKALIPADWLALRVLFVSSAMG
jgi:hypothetical protein